ncbi:spore germination protein GerPE [Alkalibacillus aidingensis]|uniref:spore germination protein GerPE n=1 Tax=Alkalibacillus aidingensis TaxID=2747607 RepID=UPI0016606AFF|nr:spore germination protein GerPE [Alkalibacillus aidingensis]
MRDSVVKTVNCQSTDNSSSIRIGDTKWLTPQSVALAVQREGAYYSREFQERHTFQYYHFMDQPFPKQLQPFQCKVSRQEKQPIKVGNINVIGITASSTLHVGSLEHGDAFSKIKHVRQLLEADDEEEVDDHETDDQVID